MSLNNVSPNQIKELSELAPLLYSSVEEIELIIQEKSDMVQFVHMKKSNGEYRKITKITNDSYRHLIKRISDYLSSKYLLHSAPILGKDVVHGFVKGRSIVTNAQQHTQKKIVLNIDIKDFFDSINIEKVQDVFSSLGFNENISLILAQLTTFEKKLPTGFSTSPVLSNFVCLTMDGVFKKVFAEKDTTYTRYADDMSFSSDGHVPPKKVIVDILEKFNFVLNENKYRLYRKGGPQYVTGLTVVDKTPRLSKKYKRSLRQEAYFIKKHGFTNHFCHVAKKIAKIRHPIDEVSCKTEFIEIVRNPKQKDLTGRLTEMKFHGYGLEGFISHINSIEPKLAKELAPLLPSKECRVHKQGMMDELKSMGLMD